VAHATEDRVLRMRLTSLRNSAAPCTSCTMLLKSPGGQAIPCRGHRIRLSFRHQRSSESSWGRGETRDNLFALKTTSGCSAKERLSQGMG
jgi:hypothetical protein